MIQASIVIACVPLVALLPLIALMSLAAGVREAMALTPLTVNTGPPGPHMILSLSFASMMRSIASVAPDRSLTTMLPWPSRKV